MPTTFNKVTFNGTTLIDISSDTTAADKTLSSYTGHENTGDSFTGSIQTLGATTYTPSETAQTITAGKYLTGDQTISAISSTYVGSEVTRKAAATITPGTTAQTIPAGTYLTGAQTIAGDADLVASNILSTANIFNVQGSVVINRYYTGSSAPSSSLGSDGDIYIQQ